MFVVVAEERHRDSRPSPVAVVVASLEEARQQAEEWLGETFWSIGSIHIYEVGKEVTFRVDVEEVETITTSTHKKVVYVG